MGYESKNIGWIDTEYLFQVEASEKEIIRNFWDAEFNRPFYEVGQDVFLTQAKSKLAGFAASDFKSVDDIYALIHPDDVNHVVNFSIRGLDFVNHEMKMPLLCRSQFVLRLKSKCGSYKTYLRECFINGVKGGKATRNVGYLKDISWMNGVQIRAWKMDGEGAEFFDYSFPEARKFTKTLTSREIEILRLLARGFHSRDIAEALKISRLTVDTHRRNMLRKVEAANTPELLTLAWDMNLKI
ncbi:regulatory protein, luxR family [Ekhidna lutea]|uniref:Regulatory protein, luxR family n=1 Tax=Ekhidna lutea TaxID=447679 RepID=A0A239LLA8_EKHLU|nr:helix-turn-helix transcriptional regulator [Ekhidna lutea]SNT31457.1 regulatory protein, luxR family [Ekhidna lutea]